MKRIVCIVAVFMVSSGIILGQNTATTNQTGNENDSKIEQIGSSQNATVTQAGELNKADVNQYAESSSNGPGEQTATVSQSGKENDAKVDMDQTGGGDKVPNTAIIEQTGNWNISDQKVNAPGYNSGQHVTGYQEGNNNNLQQIIYDGYTTSQSATQIGNYNRSIQKSWGAYKDLDILSVGDYNQAYQTAEDPKADLLIEQVGFHNYAKQHYKGTFDFVPGNTGIIEQEGHWNKSYQKITGKTENNLKVDLNGNFNFSYQEAIGDHNTSEGSVNGHKNRFESKQVGNSNTANAIIADPYGGNMNDVKIFQTGDGNDAYFGSQDGDKNDVDINQTGNKNYTEFFIKYGDNNKADYLINGDENRSRFSVDTEWGNMSDYNDLYLNQDGFKNYAAGQMKGDFNDIDILQTGEMNRVGTSWYTKSDGVNILGNYNTVNIGQYTRLNESFNIINGSNNTINVIQK